MGSKTIAVPNASRKFITDFVTKRLDGRCDEEVIDNLKLCIGETCQNIVRHSTDKVAYVTVDCDKHGLTVEIADKGPGFDIANLPLLELGQIGGYGVNIIRTHFGDDAVKSVIGEGTTVTLKVTF